MASLTWLHLSDLHACTPLFEWDAGRVTEKLVEDLAGLRRQHDLEPDLIFFTGDAAFGQIGEEEERTLAGQFRRFGEFLDAVCEAAAPGLPRDHVFLVPGNHDVDRSLVDPAQTAWLDQQRSAEPVLALIREGTIQWRRYMERLSAYRDFLRQRGFDHLLADPERLIYGLKREIRGLTVGIAGFNSAWSCGRDGEKGQLWLGGRWQRGTLRPRIQGAEVAIALAHHPPGWLVEHESPRFERELEQDFHFLLHGHEHSVWVRRGEDGFTTVAAGACYERSDAESANSYNLVRFDPESGEGEVWLRRYDPAGGGWVARQVHGRTDERGVWPLGPTPRPPAPAPPRPPSPRPPARFADGELTRYLRCLRSAHQDLPLAGFETRVRLPIRLDQVYVPLRARVYRQLMERRRLGARPELEGELGAEMGEDRDLPFDEALRFARRHRLRGAVVLGDPGSGKTTLLKHFVLACTGEEGGASLGLPADTVPVFLQLRRLEAPRAGLGAALAVAVAETLGLDEEEARAFARRLRDRDRLLVLVDGLDEVADAAERAAVARWLEKALYQLPESAFVVTSRYAGYREESRLAGRYLELHVRDLGEGEARRFIADWYGAVEAQAELEREPEVARRLAEEAAGDLRQRLFDSPDPRVANLRQLTGNPLMLQILCLVHRDSKALPEKRVELYWECMRVLLELWRKAKGMPVDLTARQAMKLLQPVAYWLHREQRKQADAEELLPRLEEPLRELGRRPEDGAGLLAAIRDQSGALVSLGQGEYAFLHLSFQEYLCARHIQDQALRDPGVLSHLAACFGDPWWREVILLAVGLDNPSLFEPLMRQLLEWGVLHRDVALADHCLSDALATTPRPFLQALDRGIPAALERYHALRLLGRLPGWEEVELGRGRTGRDLIARLARRDGDPQARGMARELLAEERPGEPPIAARSTRKAAAQPRERLHERDGTVLVYVPGGEYTLGAEDLEELGIGKEWAACSAPVHRVRLRPFWIGKYPVTHEQYARFLEENPGHPRPEYWDDKEFNQPRQPVVGVSWHDARAYCAWAGLALPSEAQWEAAARGTDGRRYPWGDEPPSPEHANFAQREGRTTPVGAFPAGAGPYGTLDQAGNVWEWCADAWDPAAYRARDGKEDPIAEGGDKNARALRGGSWFDPAGFLAAAFRSRYLASYRYGLIGFRCVLPVPAEHVGP